jgi:hypothetical protein
MKWLNWMLSPKLDKKWKNIFKIHGKTGFWITFSNNVKVSVQFLPGGLEAAVFNKNRKWITNEYTGDDDVVGFANTDELLKLLEWAKNYKNTNKQVD